MTLITVSFAAFQTYTAIYPTDSFYKSEFTDNSNIEFPENGKIILKGSTYPDIHGDYSVSAVFEVDRPSIDKLIESIQSSKNFKKDTIPFLFGGDIREKSKGLNEKLFNQNFYWNLNQSGSYYFNVAFDTTNHLVAFDIIKW